MGFMASGKSSIGRIVADKLQYNYIDLDLYIEDQEQKSISQIFSDHGEEEFRDLEHKHLSYLVNHYHNVVLPLGGGAPCFERNWDILAATRSVYLYKTNEQLFERLITRKAKRPLIANMNDEELRDLIDRKMGERSAYYERANLKVPVLHSKRQTAKQIVELIC